MNPPRNSLILSIFAILIILVALAIRVAQFTPRLSAPAPLGSSLARQPLSPSSSFYEGQVASSTLGSPASAAAPPSPPAPPTISAQAYMVGNVKTGQIYLEQDPTAVLPLASISKLFTAIAATDTIAPDTLIEITPAETDVPPDPTNLVPGEQFTLSELLYPMLLDSSNVAATAIASSSDLDTFIGSMSSYAKELGASTAQFDDPSGLSSGDRGSAEDIFALAKYLYAFRPDILAITRIAHISVATTTDHGAHEFESIHPFIGDPRFLGGKTGFTYAADDTMLTILDIGGQPIAFIVLRSQDRTADTDLLISRLGAMID